MYHLRDKDKRTVSHESIRPKLNKKIGVEDTERRSVDYDME